MENAEVIPSVSTGCASFQGAISPESNVKVMFHSEMSAFGLHVIWRAVEFGPFG
jgi:hypothetical protein